MAASRSMRGSTTLATPTFGCERVEAYLSTATPAPVRMLNRLVFPTFGNPRRPNFMPGHLARQGPALYDAPGAGRATGGRLAPPRRVVRGGGGRPARRVPDPPLVAQRAPQQELDLSVEAPQVVARPALQGREDLAVDA